MIGLLAGLWAGYRGTAQPITLVINDQPYPLQLHRLTVNAVLREMDLMLEPEDIVVPAPGSELAAGQTVTVQLAQPVLIEVDGQTQQRLTHQPTVAGALAEAGVTINAKDEILIDREPVSLDTPLPSRYSQPPAENRVAHLLLTADIPRSAVLATRPDPVRLIIHRAVPVTLYEGRVNSTFYTTQPNVGEALLEQGITLFLGDKVTPGLGARLSPGMRIFIERSVPVSLSVDGRILQTRTRAETVGQVLAQEGVALMGQDFSRPAAHQPVSAETWIEVVRVRETIEIEEEFIPFETTWIADESLELDRQELRQPGVTGVIKTRTRVRYENGQEVARRLEDKWQDQAAGERVIAYGTNIVVRTLQTENGPLEYWRRILMLATAYNAANAGKAPDHPRYGITRSGLPAGYGVVAVDPSVVPLMTELYIPGYGRAVAGDTGGSILGKHIDLGYDDDQPLPAIYEWREVYVLTPVPPAYQIRYVLPQWPQR